MIFRKKNKEEDYEPPSNDEFMQTMLFELMTERKWRAITRFIRILILFLFLATIIYILLTGPLSTKSTNTSSKPHAALIKIHGAISSDKTANADAVYKLLEKAFKNEHAKSIILSINSPGGSPVQAGRIYDDVLAFKQLYDKAVYAYIDDVGASAGYYIALAADNIYANRASLVGSIGVISSSFGLVDTINALGIERRTIKSGDHKNFFDPFSPLLDEQVDFWQKQLVITHQQFIERVIDSRGERLQLEEEGLFSGLIWNGEEAQRIGLIDGLSSPHQIAAELSGTAKIVEYSTKVGFLTSLSNKNPFRFSSSELANELITDINTQTVKLR